MTRARSLFGLLMWLFGAVAASLLDGAEERVCCRVCGLEGIAGACATCRADEALARAFGRTEVTA